MQKHNHIDMENGIRCAKIAKNTIEKSWQDTEKCDTFFLTIEGQALDPRPAAATTTIKGAYVDGRQPIRCVETEGQGGACPLLAG
ncbi:hypothetical protein [Tianweitania sediminis]|uniref:Uncharacterized protein n=1 Tax=Tianweitania sediminis TaxID=1502156 RepID=A0A8J7UL09_9HYPH|nr:hypothetical protein [Tianweitania sediminis]MBP0440430.1 hypothetical protein [Tianweitania sediminis]